MAAKTSICAQTARIRALVVQIADRLFGQQRALLTNECTIANILVRAEAPLLAAVEPIAEAVRSNDVVGSERNLGPGIRQEMIAMDVPERKAICHMIGESRATDAGISVSLAGRRLEISVGDRYCDSNVTSQCGSCAPVQSPPDAQFAIETCDTWFTPGFRRQLLQAVVLDKRRSDLQDATLAC